MTNFFEKIFSNPEQKENPEAKLKELGEKRLRLEERIKTLELDMEIDSTPQDAELLGELKKELRGLEEQSALIEVETKKAA
ncbi:MAG: hypothetical protein Q8Q06_02070 [bacterium]|nr:hypothetical protein [bacterium]